MHKLRPIPGNLDVDWLCGAEWQAGFQVGMGWPVGPSHRSAPRPPALTFPESPGYGRTVPLSVPPSLRLRPRATVWGEKYRQLKWIHKNNRTVAMETREPQPNL